MKYERKFRLDACHFNDGINYVDLRTVRLGVKDGTMTATEAAQVYERLLSSIHGHDFHVTVFAEAAVLNGSWLTLENVTEVMASPGWLIDDQEMEEVVMRYSRRNLSVAPTFDDLNLRSTTENLAVAIAHDVRLLIHKHYKNTRIDFTVTVRVQETPDIVAEYSL